MTASAALEEGLAVVALAALGHSASWRRFLAATSSIGRKQHV